MARVETSRWIAAAPVALFGAAFALGLLAYLFVPASTTAAAMLNAGIVILIASPAVRLAVAAAERIRQRDWGFAAMTAVICAELLFVLLRAARS